MVYKKFNNSAFIIDMVTVFYLFTFQAINPLKRYIIYPYKLFRSFISFAKEAFITIFNLSPPLNLNFNIQIPNR